VIPRDDLPASLAAVLEGAIDYAGLFPPAALSMDEAVANYASYRAGPERWALGRFIAPGSRLLELITGLESVAARGAPPDGWRVSVTLGPSLEADLKAATTLNQAELGARVDAVEAKVASPRAVAQVAALVPPEWACFGEVALDENQDRILDELKSAGVGAKIRMGGVTPDAFPDPNRVAGFLLAVVSRDLPFKATAGLHHPIRSRYRLTYDPASQSALMYGYLNLIVASLLAQAGAGHDTIVAALTETEARSIGADAEGLAWRGHRFSPAALLRFRHQSYQGFGSCSFREPLDELRPVLSA
jgi:hypothetical protein